MTRALAFLAALVVAALVHFAAVTLVPGFPQGVDVFLLVTVLEARRGQPVAGMLAGLAAGGVADALSGGIYGFQGFADTAVGFLIARAAQQLVIQRTSSLAFIFATGAAAQQAILAGLALVLARTGELPAPEWMFAKVATTALLGIAWTTGVERLAGRWLSWRKTRKRGLTT
ncbi:MAG: rod shape-determining protein MreD [Thermoanaerobaculia bacterium]